MSDDNWRGAHLARLQTEVSRNAYRQMQAGEEFGLKASPNTGAVQAVRLHDKAGRYLFSYIVNREGLLFYVRKPAMNEYAGIGEAFSDRFASAKRNPAGEWTLSISDEREAAAVVDWMRAVYGE